MKPEYLIGVDLGTSATKAAIYRLDGALVASAGMEIPLYYPKPGVVEQENDDFYHSAARMVRQCLAESGIDPRQVAAIAFDSQMAGIGSIDEDFKPATRFDSWLDMRCRPYIEWLEKEHGERVTSTTGCAPTCDHGPKILWWKNERPLEYARIAKFVTPAGYVAGKMAGLRADQAFMDYTFIHFSGLNDAVAGTWSADLCHRFGVEMDKLPEIVEPWRVVGELTAQAAQEFGLAQGTPVAAGAGDTAANALGAGVVRPGMLLDVAGTAAVLAGCTSEFVADVKHRALLTMRSVIPGLWNPLAYIAGGGLALRWYRDQFFNLYRGLPGSLSAVEDQSGASAHASTSLSAPDLSSLSEVEGQPGTSAHASTSLSAPEAGSLSAVEGRVEDLYDRMTRLAEGVPAGAEGLFFSPHLGGRICPASPAMRGAWVGFSWGHTQAHFLRAILESVAYEYAYYLSILKEHIPHLELVAAQAVGGGARSQAWNQIKADVLQVAYQRLEREELGTWGSAMIAGKAVGVYPDLAETASAAARSGIPAVRPRPELAAVYQPNVEAYIRLQATLKNVFETD